MSRRRAWLLSAYHSGSHATWVRWLVAQFSHYNWQPITLPGRHFRWRIRGNPLSWLHALPDETPELIVATSMVDLATLRGLHPQLSQARTLYYFHENQFAYPESDAQHGSIDPQMVQLYSALCADRLAFNSAFNQNSFLDGVEQLLRRFPDQVPSGIVEQLTAKSQVVPVAITPIPAQQKQPGLILWNHRWEYDKAPETFADALIKLKNRNIDFKLALLGQRSNKPHPALLQIRQQLADQIQIDELANDGAYSDWLGRAQIVVSTAIHEFQGLSMLEAASAGAIPLVPDDLCYPEIYPDQYRYPPSNTERLADKLQHWLENPLPPPFGTQDWHAEALMPCWQTLLD